MEQLILVFGMPRSGTTWLGKLFDSHPDTLYRHEPDTWRRLAIPRYPEPGELDQYAEIVQSFANELPKFNALRIAGKLPLFRKTYQSGMRAKLLHANIGVAHFAGQCGISLPVYMHSPENSYSRRSIVWKSIESLGRFGVVLGALPEAKGVHILRHPCGYIASVLRGQKNNKFTDSAPASEDYSIFSAAMNTPLGADYELTYDGLKSLTPEERLAWQWVLVNEKALLEAKGTGQILTIRYEDVCVDPIGSVERMFEFTGLKMAEQTRRFIETSTSKSDSRYYSVFKDPKSAASRWLGELSPQVIERVMSIIRRSRFASCYVADSIDGMVPK